MTTGKYALLFQNASLVMVLYSNMDFRPVCEPETPMDGVCDTVIL